MDVPLGDTDDDIKQLHYEARDYVSTNYNKQALDSDLHVFQQQPEEDILIAPRLTVDERVS